MPLAGGSVHSVFLSDEGQLFTCGKAEQVGPAGSEGDQVKLCLVPLGVSVMQVAVGAAHTVCLDVNGDVWTFGENYQGQLGWESRTFVREPQLVPGLPTIQHIACGIAHTVCITHESSAWGFGDRRANLWDHGVQSTTLPTELRLPTTPKYAFCGGFQTFILDEEDQLWAFGANDCGQLGLGHRSDVYEPLPVPLPDDMVIADIACGKNFTLLLSLKGSVWSTGSNTSGQLGMGLEPLELRYQCIFERIPDLRARQIACGSNHAVCVDLQDNLLVWGSNQKGQAMHTHDCAPAQVYGTVRHVTAGAHSTFVEDEKGNILSVGGNKYGQLGRGYHTGECNYALIPCKLPAPMHIGFR